MRADLPDTGFGLKNEFTKIGSVYKLRKRWDTHAILKGCQIENSDGTGSNAKTVNRTYRHDTFLCQRKQSDNMTGFI